MALGDIIEVTDQYKVADQMCINVYHYVVAVDAPVDSNQDVLAAAFATTFRALRHAVQSDEVVDVKVTGQRIFPVRNVVSDFPVTGSGTVTETPIPPNVAACVSLGTLLAGVRYRGRKYIGGIADTLVSDGELTNSTSAAWNAIKNFLFQPVVITAGPDINATYGPAILHRPAAWNGNVPGTWTLVASARVRETIRCQRRRTVGRGI